MSTAPLGGNQQKVDELEYFLERLGRYLLGPEGEDFRALAAHVPRTRNLSALLELGRSGRGGDVSEDLNFLHGEIEANDRQARPMTSQDPKAPTVLRYRRYEDLLKRPESLLDQVPPAQRLEVVNLVTEGIGRLGPLLARINAYAWLGAVGLPDLASELRAQTPAVLTLEPLPGGPGRALERIVTLQRPRAGAGLRAWALALFGELDAEYRSQLARLCGKTEPLR